jgi:hypothetical protein
MDSSRPFRGAAEEDSGAPATPTETQASSGRDDQPPEKDRDDVRPGRPDQPAEGPDDPSYTDATGARSQSEQ